MRWVLRSKIHRATVTQANPDYAGSITIDKELIEMVGLWPNEKVLVASQKTGARLDTYIIEAEEGSGIIGMNSPCINIPGPGLNGWPEGRSLKCEHRRRPFALGVEIKNSPGYGDPGEPGLCGQHHHR